MESIKSKMMTKKVMDFPLQYLNLTRRRNKKCGTYRNVNGFADDDRPIGTASPGATKTPTITFQAALFHAGIGAGLSETERKAAR